MARNIMTPQKFILHVENRLGWHPHDKNPKAGYTAMARKVRDKIETDPARYTWKNLLLAVELLAREKQPRNPLGVFAHVDRAVKLARSDDGDLETKIREAIRIEYHRNDPEGWVTRFARAVGPYRREAYDEWVSNRLGWAPTPPEGGYTAGDF